MTQRCREAWTVALDSLRTGPRQVRACHQHAIGVLVLGRGRQAVTGTANPTTHGSSQMTLRGADHRQGIRYA